MIGTFPLPGGAPVAPAQAIQAFSHWASTSQEFARLYSRYLGDVASLWTRSLEREQGKPVEAVASPAPGDSSFEGSEW